MKRIPTLLVLAVALVLSGCAGNRSLKPIESEAPKTIAEQSAKTKAAASSYASKATPVDADKLLGSDSEASNATKNFALSAIKAYVLSGGDELAATFPLSVSSAGGYTTYAMSSTGLNALETARYNSGGTAWEYATAAWLDTANAFTGANDFGGATSLEIPNGTAPTVDAAGEVAVDTTSDQLVYYGSAKRVLTYKKQIDFAVKSPADADDFLLFKAQTALTLTDIHVIAQGGTSISVDIQECDSAGANCATVDAAITADTDGAEDDGTLSNGTIDAGDWVKVVLGAPSGTVNFLAGSIYYVETAD